MFNNFSNPYGFTPSFNGFCGPFNQFGGFVPSNWTPQFGYNSVPGFAQNFTPVNAWNAPVGFTPAFAGFNGWNNWSNGFVPGAQFSGYGFNPEFAFANTWGAPFNGVSSNFESGAWAAPFGGYQGYSTPNFAFGAPNQGYATRGQYGWNGSYSPSTNPWNYQAGGTSWNGSYNGVSNTQGATGCYPVNTGVCREAA